MQGQASSAVGVGEQGRSRCRAGIPVVRGPVVRGRTVRGRTVRGPVLRGLVLALLGCLGACLGGPHVEGERMLVTKTFGGIPILGKSLFWDGQGEVDNAGFGLENQWYLLDRFSVGGSVSAMVFDAPGEHVPGIELEFLSRWHFAELGKVGLFMDGGGGYIHTESPIPPPGTADNFTFSFGLGAELPLSPSFSWLGGFRFHHMSNALGRFTPRNPSQNEGYLWLGLGTSW